MTEPTEYPGNYLTAGELRDIADLIDRLESTKISEVSFEAVLKIVDSNGEQVGTVTNQFEGQAYFYPYLVVDKLEQD